MRRARSRRLIAGIAALTAAGLALTACGSGNSNAPSAASTSTATSSGSADGSTPATAGALQVGLAYDTGGRGDGTFNDSAAVGATKAKTDFGVTLNELVPSTADDRATNVSLLSKNGNTPIICVGFNFFSLLPEVADANPKLTYAIVDAVVDKPNVKSLVFAAEQGAFMVGAAAALKTKTGKIGFIGGQDGPIIQSFEAGFVAGVKAAKPDATIDIKYLGPDGDDTVWNAPDRAKEIAASWYAGGTDIIFSAAGGSGQGTIDAAVDATAAGTQNWAIGVDSDQWALASTDAQKKVILTSELKRVDTAVYDVIKAVHDGDTKGGIQTFDLKNEGVGYSTSGGYVDDIKSQLDSYKQKVIDGSIKVPTAPTRS